MRKKKEKIKLPFYQRKWFVGFCVVLVLGVIGNLINGDNNDSKTPTNNDPVISNENGTNEQENNEPQASSVTTYKAGMYKIGTDMPAGEYLIESSGGWLGTTYLQVTSDSSGSFESIVTNDNFENRIYITVSDGQYLSFDEGVAIAVQDAQPFTPKSGLYPSGMYLVGKDIEAGEYKISVEEGSTLGYGYYAILSDSTGSFNSIIANDNIETDKYQTIQNGQYLQLSNTYIQK